MIGLALHSENIAHRGAAEFAGDATPRWWPRCDVYGLATSTGSAAALHAFEQAVHGLAAHRANTAGAIEDTLAADPDHVGAHALRGFASLILARAELTDSAAAALSKARAALNAVGGGTADERLLVSALSAAVGGSFLLASKVLDDGFADRPATFLPFKISHALRFMAGDRQGMLRASAHALHSLDETARGAGFVLGCHAFALEEHGFYTEAESVGRRAVQLQPDDAWGLHAVSHVHEMRGQTSDGIDWLETTRAAWSRCNNFSFHIGWHLGLLHLERGDHEKTLDVYDREIRPDQTDDFRDMANAVSLLWRMQQHGIDVGPRWADMAEIALKRRRDTTLIFASLHVLTALAALGEREAVAEMVAALKRKARGDGEQARVAAEIGVPMAHIIAGLDSPAERRGLDQLALKVQKLGGSNAQRDFFVLALAKAATDGADAVAIHKIKELRGRLKAEDRLFSRVEARA